MTYDEKSIRILREEEIDRFDWSRTTRLADEYHLPLEWVKRGFEAVFLEIVREERDRSRRQ